MQLELLFREESHHQSKDLIEPGLLSKPQLLQLQKGSFSGETLVLKTVNGSLPQQPKSSSLPRGAVPPTF